MESNGNKQKPGTSEIFKHLKYSNKYSNTMFRIKYTGSTLLQLLLLLKFVLISSKQTITGEDLNTIIR